MKEVSLVLLQYLEEIEMKVTVHAAERFLERVFGMDHYSQSEKYKARA